MSKVNQFLLRHPTAVGGAGGAALGAGIGRFTTRDSALKKDEQFQRRVHDAAHAAKAPKGSRRFVDIENAEKRKVRKGTALVVGSLGAAEGAFLGRAVGRGVQAGRQHRQYWESFHRARSAGAGGARRYHGDLSKHHSVLGTTGSEKTKAEVKKKYLEMAKKHHPDRGGDASKMKNVTSAYDDIKKSPWFEKLSFWSGFNVARGGV